MDGEDNTFIVTDFTDDTEPPEGTGFFVTLADLGVETMEVDGTSLSVSDEEGNVTVDRDTALNALTAAILDDGSVTLTFDVPYGDGTQTAPVDYTFIIESPDDIE